LVAGCGAPSTPLTKILQKAGLIRNSQWTSCHHGNPPMAASERYDPFSPIDGKRSVSREDDLGSRPMVHWAITFTICLKDVFIDREPQNFS
jgi:hypothetical protein